MRRFNTEGPVRPAEHYCIPPLGRVDLPHLLGLVRDKRYFVLHAPRQTGKTSALLALCDRLNDAASMSMCSHSALRTSPERTAVGTRCGGFGIDVDARRVAGRSAGNG